MNWWLYKGSVTTPVVIPGRGPTIIQPRMKFQAPPAAVAHLKRIGMVVPCKDPNPPKKEAPAPAAEPAPEVPKSVVPNKKSETTPPKGGSDDVAPVVASTPFNPEQEPATEKEPQVDESGDIEEDAEEEGESQQKSQQKKEGKRNRTGSKRRRG